MACRAAFEHRIATATVSVIVASKSSLQPHDARAQSGSTKYQRAGSADREGTRPASPFRSPRAARVSSRVGAAPELTCIGTNVSDTLVRRLAGLLQKKYRGLSSSFPCRRRRIREAELVAEVGSICPWGIGQCGISPPSDGSLVVGTSSAPGMLCCNLEHQGSRVAAAPENEGQMMGQRCAEHCRKPMLSSPVSYAPAVTAKKPLQEGSPMRSDCPDARPIDLTAPLSAGRSQ
jgi:hypothetical protein